MVFVVCNSEGGLGRLRELGARRAEAIFWGADPELFRPLPVEKTTDVYFYGYGEKFRADWIESMVVEPSGRLTDADFALGGNDFRSNIGNARYTGDVPFNVFPNAISAARINLNITRRPHATVPASSTSRPFELAMAGATIVSNPHAGIERWFEPGRELVVVDERRRSRVGVRGAARRRRSGRAARPCGAGARPRRAHVRPPRAASARAARGLGADDTTSESRAWEPEPTSESGEYWKEHVLSWEAGAYYKDRQCAACLLGPGVVDLPRKGDVRPHGRGPAARLTAPRRPARARHRLRIGALCLPAPGGRCGACRRYRRLAGRDRGRRRAAQAEPVRRPTRVQGHGRDPPRARSFRRSI